ncbi:MAG: hypothetical protein FWE16_01305 [Firmicutes bacterium]|nr:hypothetical protein [Bacillota bacterium]
MEQNKEQLKKQRIRNILIAVGCVLLATYLLLFVFTTWVVIVPRGYADSRYGNIPIVRVDGTEWVYGFTIANQFPELNDPSIFSQRRYFMFNGQLHHIHLPQGSFFALRSDEGLSVRKNDEILGSFINEIDRRSESSVISIFFLHNDSIYYKFTARRTAIFTRGILHARTTISFAKYRYFRFCLINFTNEQIDLERFGATLNTASSGSFKINENFRTR